eukprot:1158268-Pelagomonas_calceolata.AAC.5
MAVSEEHCKSVNKLRCLWKHWRPNEVTWVAHHCFCVSLCVSQSLYVTKSLHVLNLNVDSSKAAIGCFKPRMNALKATIDFLNGLWMWPRAAVLVNTHGRTDERAALAQDHLAG